GQKLNDLSDKFYTNKNKKVLIDELFKVVQIENSKRAKQSAKEKRAQKAREDRIKQEAEKKVEVIREKKKEQKQKEIQIEKEQPKVTLKVGDRVRLPDGRAVGTIHNIEKGKAIVDYGMFTTNVDVETLELVQRAKQ
ncbi:MAG: DNA mismatch repair protein MutS, partial [Leeuwenhoekiella sp.]|nr:DNA mismatch repair protein MutS [Leeuwenhoekiella sp.]